MERVVNYALQTSKGNKINTSKIKAREQYRFLMQLLK